MKERSGKGTRKKRRYGGKKERSIEGKEDRGGKLETEERR